MKNEHERIERLTRDFREIEKQKDRYYAMLIEKQRLSSYPPYNYEAGRTEPMIESKGDVKTDNFIVAFAKIVGVFALWIITFLATMTVLFGIGFLLMQVTKFLFL